VPNPKLDLIYNLYKLPDKWKSGIHSIRDPKTNKIKVIDTTVDQYIHAKPDPKGKKPKIVETKLTTPPIEEFPWVQHDPPKSAIGYAPISRAMAEDLDTATVTWCVIDIDGNPNIADGLYNAVSSIVSNIKAANNQNILYNPLPVNILPSYSRTGVHVVLFFNKPILVNHVRGYVAVVKLILAYGLRNFHLKCTSQGFESFKFDKVFLDNPGLRVLLPNPADFPEEPVIINISKIVPVPPCMQSVIDLADSINMLDHDGTLPSIIKKGERNNTTYQLTLYLRYFGVKNPTALIYYIMKGYNDAGRDKTIKSANKQYKRCLEEGSGIGFGCKRCPSDRKENCKIGGAVSQAKVIDTLEKFKLKIEIEKGTKNEAYILTFLDAIEYRFNFKELSSWHTVKSKLIQSGAGVDEIRKIDKKLWGEMWDFLLESAEVKRTDNPTYLMVRNHIINSIHTAVKDPAVLLRSKDKFIGFFDNSFHVSIDKLVYSSKKMYKPQDVATALKIYFDVEPTPYTGVYKIKSDELVPPLEVDAKDNLLASGKQVSYDDIRKGFQFMGAEYCTTINGRLYLIPSELIQEDKGLRTIVKEEILKKRRSIKRNRDF